MKKIFKFIKVTTLVILLLIFIFLIILFINNKILFKKESSILKPNGKIISVNDKKLHVYSEGEGNITCVMMSGLGIPAPSLEFKGLYKHLSKEFRIAVVDRSGYGFSSTSKDPRDIDSILEETRESLKLAGIAPPYILFPHSISGLEAIYWAQKYPSEVAGIIGLDMGFPEGYSEESPSSSSILMMKAQSFLVKLGVHRLFPSLFINSDVLESDFLTSEEKEMYKALCYKNVLNDEVINEFSSIEENSKKSLELPLPVDTPICMFLAVPMDKNISHEKDDFLKERYNYYKDYISKFNKGKIIEHPGNHWGFYLYSPEKIAEKTLEFLNESKV